MGLDKFDKFNEGSAGVAELMKRTEKDLIKTIIKDVKKLRSFGNLGEHEGFEDARKGVLEILKKHLK